MSDEQLHQTTQDVWADDRLGRKPYADFLTTYLRNRCVTEKDGARTLTPFCISIDAKWGEGKTFFLQTWMAALQQEARNPVFLFDAWTSDFDTDPIVAFMAAFKHALDAEIEKLPAAFEAEKSLADGVRKLGKAVVPTLKALGRAVVEKHAPGFFGAVADIATESESSNDGEARLDEQLDSAKDTASEALFKSLLAESTKRKELIADFRKEIEQTLRYLADNGEVELPMFVFIDELDRCRPMFAVELLEGLKHIFNIPGLCFVVATNIEQLAHSVKAVYGEGFDGTAYLQRFFDVGYVLPRQDPTAFLRDLVDRKPVFAKDQCYPGVPPHGFIGYAQDDGCHIALEWVATEFDLDLRSQRRVVEMASAVLESFNKPHGRHAMWAFMLSAAYVKDRTLFECLKQDSPHATLVAAWRNAGLTPSTRWFKERDGSRVSVELKTIAEAYVTARNGDTGTLRHKRDSAAERYDTADYLWEFYRKLVDDCNSSLRQRESSVRTVFSDYPQLVECAGFLTNP